MHDFNYLNAPYHRRFEFNQPFPVQRLPLPMEMHFSDKEFSLQRCPCFSGQSGPWDVVFCEPWLLVVRSGSSRICDFAIRVEASAPGYRVVEAYANFNPAQTGSHLYSSSPEWLQAFRLVKSQIAEVVIGRVRNCV